MPRTRERTPGSGLAGNLTSVLDVAPKPGQPAHARRSSRISSTSCEHAHETPATSSTAGAFCETGGGALFHARPADGRVWKSPAQASPTKGWDVKISLGVQRPGSSRNPTRRHAPTGPARSQHPGYPLKSVSDRNISGLLTMVSNRTRNESLRKPPFDGLSPGRSELGRW